ncbi:MAG: ATP synthase subunit I [Mariprofundus sp.]
MKEYASIYRHQFLAGLILFFVLVLTGRYIAGASCLFGASLMALGSWELARRLHKADMLNSDKLQASLFRGAAVRFMLILIGLAVGYLLGLYLPAVAGGMFAAQVLFYVASLRRFGSAMNN